MGMTPRVRIAFCVLCAFFILCLVVALMPGAHAQAMCTQYKALQAALAERHEVPAGAGLMGEGQFAWTLFTSPKGEDWTMVIVDTKGMACVVGGGKNWTDLGPGKGDPT